MCAHFIALNNAIAASKPTPTSQLESPGIIVCAENHADHTGAPDATAAVITGVVFVVGTTVCVDVTAASPSIITGSTASHTDPSSCTVAGG